MKLGGGEPLCLQLFGCLFFCLYWISLCVAPYHSIWLERRGLLKNSLFGSMFGGEGEVKGLSSLPSLFTPFHYLRIWVERKILKSFRIDNKTSSKNCISGSNTRYFHCHLIGQACKIYNFNDLLI